MKAISGFQYRCNQTPQHVVLVLDGQAVRLSILPEPNCNTSTPSCGSVAPAYPQESADEFTQGRGSAKALSKGMRTKVINILRLSQIYPCSTHLVH